MRIPRGARSKARERTTLSRAARAALTAEVDPGVVEVQWWSSASIVPWGTLGVLDTNRVKRRTTNDQASVAHGDVGRGQPAAGAGDRAGRCDRPGSGGAAGRQGERAARGVRRADAPGSAGRVGDDRAGGDGRAHRRRGHRGGGPEGPPRPGPGRVPARQRGRPGDPRGPADPGAPPPGAHRRRRARGRAGDAPGGLRHVRVGRPVGRPHGRVDARRPVRPPL
jgi:hypothetical protein